MSWGAFTWGVDEWGGAYELGAARLLYITRMSPRFRALADAMDARYARISGILEQIRVGFNLDDAVGAQLDILGAKLGREREGMTDARYRRAIRVQSLILSSTSATTPGMLAVWRAWIGSDATDYRNVAPAYVEIGGPVAAADESLLRRFLQLAVSGGVVLSIVASAEGGDGFLLVDSVADPVADPGVLDSVADPVTDARAIGYEL